MNKKNIELFKKNWKLFFRKEICNGEIIYIEKLARQAKDEEQKRILKELPQNPYPEKVFPMTDKDYVKAIPDERLRTAISGYMGRWVWDNCIKSTKEAIREE